MRSKLIYRPTMLAILMALLSAFVLALYLGQIYSQKKRNTDAVTELEKYLEMVPKAPNADRIKQAIEQLKKG